MKQNCIPFTRSDAFCYPEYTLNTNKPREQFNALTAFLDLSSVYGSEIEVSKPLRAVPSKDSENLKIAN